MGSRDAYVSARCQSASSELAARSGQGREDAMSTARRSRPRLTDSGLRIWRGRVGTVVAVLDCGWQKGQAAHVRVQRAFITANPSGSMCSSQSEGAKGCEEQLALLARLVDPEEQAPRPAEPAGGLSTARREPPSPDEDKRRCQQHETAYPSKGCACSDREDAPDGSDDEENSSAKRFQASTSSTVDCGRALSASGSDSDSRSGSLELFEASAQLQFEFNSFAQPQDNSVVDRGCLGVETLEPLQEFSRI